MRTHRIFIVGGFRAGQIRWLEYKNGIPISQTTGWPVPIRASILQANERRSRRLRRQVRMSIELGLSPQPSVTPTRPTSLAKARTARTAQFGAEVGQRAVVNAIHLIREMAIDPKFAPQRALQALARAVAS